MSNNIFDLYFRSSTAESQLKIGFPGKYQDSTIS